MTSRFPLQHALDGWKRWGEKQRKQERQVRRMPTGWDLEALAGHWRQAISGSLEALDQLQTFGGRRIAQLLRRRFKRLTLQAERLRDITLPEVEAMRSAGAYIELPRSEPVPIVEGARLTHAEVSGSSDSMRVYYFYPADSPELYHHEEVCRQRGLETALQIHRLLGGGTVDEDPPR